MEEIKGTVTTAISYAKTIDPKAREQIQRMCSYEVTRGSRVRIMPDVHFGKGCTISEPRLKSHGDCKVKLEKASPFANFQGAHLHGSRATDYGPRLPQILLDKFPHRWLY